MASLQRKPASCYLCGVPLKRGVNRSKDHIPPDNIFPSGTLQITVPCCIKCNGDYSSVDEIMRNRLVFTSEFSPPLLRNTAQRSMKNAIAKVGDLNLFDAIDEEGRNRIGIRFNDHIALRWLERIVRGHHYYLYREPLSKEAKITTSLLPQAVPDFLREQFDNDRLKCFYCDIMPKELSNDFVGPNKTVWMMIFYQKLFFISIVE